MSPPFFPKTWCWRDCNKSPKRFRGSVSLLAAFLAVIFSSIGLGIIHVTLIHMRLVSHKKDAVRLDHAAESGLKDSYAYTTQLLRNARRPLALTDEELASIERDAERQGVRAIETLLERELPIFHVGQVQHQSWQSQVSFSLRSLWPYEDYFKAEYRAEISTVGRVTNIASQRESQLEAFLELQAGRIPLALLPILIAGNYGNGEAQEFLEKNDIRVIESGQRTPVAPPVVAMEDILPETDKGLIAKAFRIDTFHPQDLTPALLREAIGLENSQEPIPEGVYLIQDDLGLGGIYAKGDLEQMVLAIEGPYQVIAFWQDTQCWVLKFNPSISHTQFNSPTSEQTFDLIPLGIILVDGRIDSLGGGAMDSTGIPRLITDSEIPCILKGVDLTIVSSDRITITSHLIHQGLKWQDGIPYTKDTDSQLHIFASGTTVLGDESGAGAIILGPEGPDNMKVQANLTAAKEGISLLGQDRSVELIGSMHFPEYLSNGNELKLYLDSRIFADPAFLRNAPRTLFPVIVYTSWKAISWRTRV